jgi:hypothetical protein
MGKAIKKILYCIFGEWNGVQNLILMNVLIFLFDKATFSEWIIGLVSQQRYYLPLFFYMFFLFFLVFILIKAVVQWMEHDKIRPLIGKPRVVRDLLLPLFIKLHYGLFAILMSVVVVFVLKVGFEFVYRTNLPFFTLFILLVRLSMIFCIIYVYSLLDVIIPLIRRGHSFDRAHHYYYLRLVKNWPHSLPVISIQLFLIVISVLLFKNIIRYLDEFNNMGLFSYMGNPLFIRFEEGKSVLEVLTNTGLIGIGFLISNLLYCPLMLLLNKGFTLLKINLHR